MGSAGTERTSDTVITGGCDGRRALLVVGRQAGVRLAAVESRSRVGCIVVSSRKTRCVN